jgi:hypothetical protein
MDVVDDHPPAGRPLESREPALEDLVDLCRQLNAQGAEYVVVGGFAMRAAGYVRRTMDIDLLIATGPGNEARVLKALESLPDAAARELRPGEVAQYAVVRVADEIVVDLLGAAGGVEYGEAAGEVDVREIDGVAIPFASPRLLWRTKRSSLRDKDKPDLHFLRLLFQQSGQQPPE